MPPESLAWTCELSDQAIADLKAISLADRTRILKYLYERLQRWPDPRKLGEPMVGSFSGFWRFRVGDFRAICHLDLEKRLIRIAKIGHRREVYR